tara:strand:- start:628 stop:798 length:171 start_codon:yes stop_codon:yes gene_type:complete
MAFNMKYSKGDTAFPFKVQPPKKQPTNAGKLGRGGFTKRTDTHTDSDGIVYTRTKR